MAKKLVVIDTDCGIDDAQAIIMALAAPDVQVLGVTCVFGNAAVDDVCQNVLRVLSVCEREGVNFLQLCFVIGYDIYLNRYNVNSQAFSVYRRDASCRIRTWPTGKRIQDRHIFGAIYKLIHLYTFIKSIDKLYKIY